MGYVDCMIIAAAGFLTLYFGLASTIISARKELLLPLPLLALSLLGLSLAALLLYSLPLFVYASASIDCCITGTYLDFARNDHFINQFIGNFWLAAALIIGLTVVAFVLAKLSRLAAILVGTAVVVGGTLSWVGFYHLSRNADTLIDVVAEARDVPVFPGATEVVVDQKSFRWFNWHDITFKTDKPVKEVLAFYKEEMPRRGWAYQPESSGDSIAVFLRSDTGTDAPWNYELTVNVTLLNKVLMWVRRYPDLERMPVYPGAVNVQRASKPVTDETKEHTLTYTAQDSPDKIRAWYKAKIDGYGWWKEESVEGAPLESLQFVYEIIESPNGRKVADMVITTAAQPDNETRVDVRAVGYGIP